MARIDDDENHFVGDFDHYKVHKEHFDDWLDEGKDDWLDEGKRIL